MAQADHLCTILDATILDEPITDLVLRRCSFAEHAEMVLTQIEAEYNTAREEARRRQRELTHLQEEVETLKHNLALTRTAEQVTMLFEQIDQRMQRIAALADEHNCPVGRVLSAAQVSTVKAFLADLRLGWQKQPPELQNELFRLLLERVVIEASVDHVTATVVWRGGLQQRLWIERPRLKRGGKPPWTDEENAWLQQHYTTATPEALQAHFPHRSYKTIRRHAERLGLHRPRRCRAEPRGALWRPEENAVLQAYAAGEISHTDLLTQLPGRSWDGIESQARTLHLSFRRRPLYYQIVEDNRDIVSQEDHPVVPSELWHGGCGRSAAESPQLPARCRR